MTTEGNTQFESTYEDRAPRRRSRLFLLLVGVVILLVIAGAFTLLERRSQYQALANETEKLAVPTVSVIHPVAESGQEDAHQRIPEKVVPRHREPRAKGRPARGH